MLRLWLPEKVMSEPNEEEFKLPAVELRLEHSLISLSKWEQIHEKVFFSRDGMTREETKSYIEQMLLSEPPSFNWIDRFEPEHFELVTTHINKKHTATWFPEESVSKNSSEIITNELIYYWMISFQIPFDPCETWHVNRLMTLVKVCGIKQTKPKKMSRQAQAEEYRRLNESRRNKLGTAG